MEDELREAVESYAQLHGLDRTAAVKELLKQSLAAPVSPRAKKKK
jgi:hypothetical protein